MGDQAIPAQTASSGGLVLRSGSDSARSHGHPVPPGTITPLVFEDQQRHLIAMAAVPEPHYNWKSMLLAGNLDLTHLDQFGELLASIHYRAWEQRDQLPELFSDQSFFESLLLDPCYVLT